MTLHIWHYFGGVVALVTLIRIKHCLHRRDQRRCRKCGRPTKRIHQMVPAVEDRLSSHSQRARPWHAGGTYLPHTFDVCGHGDCGHVGYVKSGLSYKWYPWYELAWRRFTDCLRKADQFSIDLELFERAGISTGRITRFAIELNERRRSRRLGWSSGRAQA